MDPFATVGSDFVTISVSAEYQTTIFGGETRLPLSDQLFSFAQ
jgi:hypothetical protein